MFSGTHWGSWNVSCMDKAGLLYMVALHSGLDTKFEMTVYFSTGLNDFKTFSNSGSLRFLEI